MYFKKKFSHARIVAENHIFFNATVCHGTMKLLDRERSLLWPQKLSLITKNCHGEVLEGNACRKKC